MKKQNVNARHSQIDEVFEKGTEKLVQRNDNFPEFLYHPSAQQKNENDFEMNLMSSKMKYLKASRNLNSKKLKIVDRENSTLEKTVKKKTLTEVANMKKVSDGILISSDVLLFMINPKDLGQKTTQSINVVNADKNMRRIRVNVLNSDFFKISKVTYPNPKTSEIAPGNSLIVDVEFCANNLEIERVEKMQFASETANFEITLKSEFPKPDLHFPRSIDFGNVFIDQETVLFLDVMNIGIQDEFQITFVDQNNRLVSVFTTESSCLTIGYEERTKIAVLFKPTTAQIFIAKVLFTGNQSSFEGKIVGNGCVLEIAPVLYQQEILKPAQAVVFKEMIFEDFVADRVYNRSLTLKNFGQLSVDFALQLKQSKEERFSVVPESGTFKPGQEIEFHCQFSSSIYQKNFTASLMMMFPRLPDRAIKEGLCQTHSNNLQFSLKANFKQCKIETIGNVIENQKPFFVNKKNYITTQVEVLGEGLMSLKIINDLPDCECLLHEFFLQSEINERHEKKINSRFYSTNISQFDKFINLSFLCCSVKTGCFSFQLELTFETCKKVVTLKLKFDDISVFLQNDVVDFGEVLINERKELFLELKNESCCEERVLVFVDSPQIPSFSSLLGIFLMSENERCTEMECKKSLFDSSVVSITSPYVTIDPFSTKEVCLTVGSGAPIESFECKLLIVGESACQVRCVGLSGSFKQPSLTLTQRVLQHEDVFTFKEYFGNSLKLENPNEFDLNWHISDLFHDNYEIKWHQKSGKILNKGFALLEYSFKLFKTESFKIDCCLFFGSPVSFESNENSTEHFQILFANVKAFPLIFSEWNGPMVYLKQQEQIEEPEKSKNETCDSKCQSSSPSKNKNSSSFAAENIVNNDQKTNDEFGNDIQHQGVRDGLLKSSSCVNSKDENTKENSKVLANHANKLSNQKENSSTDRSLQTNNESVQKNQTTPQSNDENNAFKSTEIKANLPISNDFTTNNKCEIQKIEVFDKLWSPQIKKYSLKNEGDAPISFSFSMKSSLLKIENDFLVILKVLKKENPKCSTLCNKEHSKKPKSSSIKTRLHPISCPFHSLVEFELHEKTGPLNLYKKESNFASESGCFLHLKRNLKMFFEKNSLANTQISVASSIFDGVAQPGQQIEVVLAFFSKEAIPFYSDTLSINVENRIFKSIPIRGSFVGNKFEILETQIYMRTLEPNYRILKFKKHNSVVSHLIKIQNLTNNPLKIFAGIYSTFDGLKEDKTQRENESSYSNNLPLLDTKMKLENEMKNLKKGTLLKNISIKKREEDLMWKSIQSFDFTPSSGSGAGPEGLSSGPL
jgi:hypothetical protein